MSGLAGGPEQYKVRRSVARYRRLCVLSVFILLPAAQNLATPFLYITNSTSNTVSVVDARTLRLIREIPVGKEPFGMAFSPDGRRAYVANAQSREVSVIDASRHQLLQNVVVPSELPVWVAVSPDGWYVYVTNERSDDVAVIASASNQVVGQIPVGKGPAGIVVSPDSRYAYVADEGSNDVSLIDLQREAVINTIPVGKIPQGITMSLDGAWVYVANFGSDSVSVIATARNEVTAEIPVGQGPVAVAVSPDGKFVYTGNFKSGSLSIMSMAHRREIGTVQIGPETFGVGISQSGQEVYVASGKERQVLVVNAKTRAITNKATVGHGPFKLALRPEVRTAFRLGHLWMILSVLSLSALLYFCFVRKSSTAVPKWWQLAAVFGFGLILRVGGLGWGIPVYDAETARGAADLRVSFHPDEDNFLWNLTRVRPSELDFAVTDFHWGTLQYHLIELALLMSQALQLVSTPWRESFLSFHPTEYARIFVTGRAVSAILGACSILLAYGVGSRLHGRRAGLISALVVALMPLHVIKSHDLTPDVTMSFLVLAALWRLLIAMERPSLGNYLFAGLLGGLAVSAKYTAASLPLAVLVAHCFERDGRGAGKLWFYPGALLGFFLGEPYALIHRQQFWTSLEPYLQFGKLPEGAVPGVVPLLLVQLKNLAVFGMGVPLTFILLAAASSALHSYRNAATSNRFSGGRSWLTRKHSSTASQTRLFTLTALFFLGSILFLRQPMLRYTLPVAVLLVFPLAKYLVEISAHNTGHWLAMTALFFTGGLTLLQERILTQPHTANQAFDWIERHIPRGASIQKGWPELPPLNPDEFRIINFFSQPRMADFARYFIDEAGNPRFPDYVVLDNLPTLAIPSTFMDQVSQNYSLVAEFRRPPSISSFELPEWDAPHDWKYTHPEIRIYRKTEKVFR